MDIADWRKKIDAIDGRLVELLNERAKAAQEIGKLKRNTNLAIYEPDRERTIYENVRRINGGPLPDNELRHIYERIIDVMRNLQKNQAVATSQSDDVTASDRPASDMKEKN